MHKILSEALLVDCGKPAGKLVVSLCKRAVFVQVIKNTTAGHVHNRVGFSGAFTALLPSFFHDLNSLFMSVKRLFLTSFHSTYYYERLSNISYIN